MISNLNQIRDEAIKRTKITIDSVRPQNLTRKEVRAIALKDARNTIELLSKIDNDEEELDEAIVDLLAQKVVLVAMKSF